MLYKVFTQVRVSNKKINEERLKTEEELHTFLGKKLVQYGPPIEYDSKQGRLFEYEGKTKRGDRIEIDVLVSKSISNELIIVKPKQEPEAENILALIDAKVFK